MNVLEMPHIDNRNYTLTRAPPYMCVPACLSMVIQKELSVSLSPKVIANFFSINAPQGSAGSNPDKIGAVLKQDDINEFFQMKQLPLREEYVPIACLPEWEFEDRITESLLEGKHIICGYSYGYLHNNHELLPIGHVSLITGIRPEAYITILDPGPDGAGLKNAAVDCLFNAIRRKRDGLWIIARGR